ncbi:MAG TPA: Pycsar system effector family protein [Prolixibacteraceae bacterium]|nr:Pycsar system effector family protein [Prolixibacteraceae bacterium]
MKEIVSQSENYVLNLFKEELPDSYLYHNFTHTQRVLSSTEEIIDKNPLNENEKLILRLSALFHDTGYIKTYDNHEEESAEIARNFLKKKNVENGIVSEVEKCILATRKGVQPENRLQEIIVDADNSHVAKDYFEEVSEFLRKELELLGISTYSQDEWLQKNIEFLTTGHKFYSAFAIQNWNTGKEKNLSDLMGSKEKQKKKEQKEDHKAQVKAKYKDKTVDRGIQTFYRVTLRNHIKLSDIADTKANILLSVNAIIISLLLTNLIAKFDDPANYYLFVPSVIFVIFCVIAIVMSIIVTRPNVTRGKFNLEDVQKKKVNLAFFGNFHKMSLEDYEQAIDDMLEDRDYIYSSLTKDLYFLGKVLDKKYKMLRHTYNVFMVGIIISAIAFIIGFLAGT